MSIEYKLLLQLIKETIDQCTTCKKCGIMRSDLDDNDLCSACLMNGSTTRLELLPAPLSPEQGYNGKTTKTMLHPPTGNPNSKGWKAI